jgi:hypothetical protein
VEYKKTRDMGRLGARSFAKDGVDSPVFKNFGARECRLIPVPVEMVSICFAKDGETSGFHRLRPLSETRPILLNSFADSASKSLLVVGARIDCKMGSNVKSIEVRHHLLEMVPAENTHGFIYELSSMPRAGAGKKSRRKWKPLFRRPLVPHPTSVLEHGKYMTCTRASDGCMLRLDKGGNHHLFLPTKDFPLSIEYLSDEDREDVLAAQPSLVRQVHDPNAWQTNNPADARYCKFHLYLTLI